MFHALKCLHAEHSCAAEREEEHRAQEATRMEKWIQDLWDNHQKREAHFL